MSDSLLYSLRTATDAEALDHAINCPITLEYVEPILYCLYNLSKFENQTIFVDTIYARIKDVPLLHDRFLTNIILMWPNILHNRKDKFYYFIKLLYKDGLKILNTNYSNEIKNYIIRNTLVFEEDGKIDNLMLELEFIEDLGIVRCICESVIINKNRREIIKKVIQKTKCSYKKRLLGSFCFKK